MQGAKRPQPHDQDQDECSNSDSRASSSSLSSSSSSSLSVTEAYLDDTEHFEVLNALASFGSIETASTLSSSYHSEPLSPIEEADDCTSEEGSEDDVFDLPETSSMSMTLEEYELVSSGSAGTGHDFDLVSTPSSSPQSASPTTQDLDHLTPATLRRPHILSLSESEILKLSRSPLPADVQLLQMSETSSLADSPVTVIAVSPDPSSFPSSPIPPSSTSPVVSPENIFPSPTLLSSSSTTDSSIIDLDNLVLKGAVSSDEEELPISVSSTSSGKSAAGTLVVFRRPILAMEEYEHLVPQQQESRKTKRKRPILLDCERAEKDTKREKISIEEDPVLQEMMVSFQIDDILRVLDDRGSLDDISILNANASMTGHVVAREAPSAEQAEQSFEIEQPQSPLVKRIDEMMGNMRIEMELKVCPCPTLENCAII